jgi:hypothetical protein
MLTRPPSVLLARRQMERTNLPRAPISRQRLQRRSKGPIVAAVPAVPAAADGAATTKAANAEIRPLKKAASSTSVEPEERVPDIPKVDWDARRRRREREEIAAAGARLKPPLPPASVEQGLDNLEVLLPGVPVGCLDLLKASEWALVASDPMRAARSALALRAAFPRADTSLIIRRAPRLALLRAPEDVARDAAEARAALDPTLGRDDLAAVDAAVELVPDLATPKGVATALSLLRKWHPSIDPYELLRKDPTKLVNQDESDLEADPAYGEVTSAG